MPYITRGYHTVPLSGKLARDSKGKKSIPSFELGWREKYTGTKSTKAATLGGLLTGKLSGVVAVDCDSQATTDLFKQLDPYNEVVFVSEGKQDSDGNDIRAATYLYQYEGAPTESFSRNDNVLKLDYFADGGFVYAATEANKTKRNIEAAVLDKLRPMPQAIKDVLLAVMPSKTSADAMAVANKTWDLNLKPQIEQMVATGKPNRSLFKILTPKDFRDLPAYQQVGWLHPADVPDGRGSEYMSKVSAILGADCSVDEELYLSGMFCINGMFKQPMPTKRLEATITDPMVEGRAAVNGEVIWQFDENWEASRLAIATKRHELVEGFYDPSRMAYYLVNQVQSKYLRFDKFDGLYQHIEAIAASIPKKANIKASMPLVDVSSNPRREFGFYGADVDNFNTFVQTPELAVFRNPAAYSVNYKEPIYTLKYLKTLIPCDTMRDYILGHLKYKLNTFDYSPVVLYLMGVAGSGKDTLFKIIQRLIGEPSTAAPTAKSFTELYNPYMLDTYFVQLDEYGDQLSHKSEQDAVLGKLKAYTGKRAVDVRLMRTDSFQHLHNVTFILTANRNPLVLDADDRRVAYCNTPNKLGNEGWVEQLGGLSVLMDTIEKESLDFSYWLAEEAKSLTADEYMEPPATAEKKTLIASMFSAGRKLEYMLMNEMYTELDALANDYGVPDLMKQANAGCITEDALFELYLELTDDAGTMRGLTKSLADIPRKRTTVKGARAFLYIPAHLDRWHRRRSVGATSAI